MDTADELLVLAHSIELYDRMLDAQTELANMQAPVPHILIGRTRQQLTSLAQLWWADVHGDPVWSDAHLATVVEEAREWTAARQVRLSELREGKPSVNN